MADTGHQESSLPQRIVTIFGSSKPEEGTQEYEDARLLGERLASNGLSVCTGGYRGTMEAVSKGASQYDVKIIGVTSAIFSPTPNQYVNVQIHTQTLYERLEKLVDLGDGYLILKGGTGTLVEFAMVWELMNKGLTPEKPIIAVAQNWKPIVEVLDRELKSEGMVSCAKYVRLAKDAAEAAEMMLKALAPR